MYALERFLARLTQTPYRDDFVLKGGVLLAAYGLRRPTRDIDAQLIDRDLDAAHLLTVVRAVADVATEDALVLHVEDAWVEQIRDEDAYTGLRVHVAAHVHTFDVSTFKVDVSTGDPISPQIDTIELPTILTEDTITLRAHPLPTVVAEKTVTVIERGTTSTRWRDLMDVVTLARTHTFNAGELNAAGNATAAHRGANLGPLAPLVKGYGEVGQAKWAAWRRAWQLEDRTERSLDTQAELVAAFVDPVYAGNVTMAATWNPDAYEWREPGSDPE
ncbi:hypothetical protein Cch01nite_13650 [Cellulomonas chitinilytica]|uniref:Nucleotidyl transferase AbiEii/AbiGii toxin family protein n=1 Tax=Cellulomonas chitinilytica TaxID=398759 RepID=A0A919P2V5_9CELL|nr:hypothetical protein Cch01nite_13650 [Cellulomonas chitinilytica]